MKKAGTTLITAKRIRKGPFTQAILIRLFNLKIAILLQFHSNLIASLIFF